MLFRRRQAVWVLLATLALFLYARALHKQNVFK